MRMATNVLGTASIVLCAALISVPTAVAGGGTWVGRASMHQERHAHGLLAAPNGRLYAIAGGSWAPLTSVEEYNPAADSWTRKTDIPANQAAPGFAVGLNGKIYVIGGYSYDSHTYLSTVREYDPASDTWRDRAPMPTPRANLGAATAADGMIYAVGGSIDQSQSFSTVEKYDPMTDTWYPCSNMPTPRQNSSVVAVNSRLYVIGGYDLESGLVVNTVEEYDTSKDSWRTRSAMPTARAWAGAAAANNGKIYVVGGGTQYPPMVTTSVVEEYDPVHDTWAAMPSVSPARSQVGVASANGRIYAAGGWQCSGCAPLNTLEEFTPPFAELVPVPSASAVYPGDPVSVALDIRDASHLYAAQASCTVDPQILAPQSAAFGDFFDPVNRLIGANRVDGGSWLGAISQRSPAGPLSGNGLFATVAYSAVSPGTTAISCVPLFSDRDGLTLLVSFGTPPPPPVTVLPFASIRGMARYQGRTVHSGIEVCACGRCVTTDAEGAFTVGQLRAGTCDLTADGALYLANTKAGVELTAGAVVAVGATTLRGGDTNDDGTINIGDAALVAANFGLTVPPADPRADINNDGVVNVQDLAILAGNYELSGPLPWELSGPLPW